MILLKNTADTLKLYDEAGGTTMIAKPVKVTRKGQITLPVELRKELDIKEGDIVYVRRGERGIEVLHPEELTARVRGALRDYAQNGPVEWDREEIWTDIAREREERVLRQIAKEQEQPDDND
jgi:AbrB family looped-hinge helix DNA binding protein